MQNSLESALHGHRHMTKKALGASPRAGGPRIGADPKSNMRQVGAYKPVPQVHTLAVCAALHHKPQRDLHPTIPTPYRPNGGNFTLTETFISSSSSLGSCFQPKTHTAGTRCYTPPVTYLVDKFQIQVADMAEKEASSNHTDLWPA